jgi:excisionase family DNA binding protein
MVEAHQHRPEHVTPRHHAHARDLDPRHATSTSVSPFETTLRDMIVEVVRVELAKSQATPPTLDEYLSTRNAANLAQVATGTIRRWIREGRIEGHKAGRVVRIKRAEIETLLRAGSRPPANDESPRALARRMFG